MASDFSGGPMGELPAQMDWILDEMLGRPFTRFCPVNAWQPAVNLYETETNFIVCVDLAGMGKKDFDVSVQQNVLVIRGTRQRPTCGPDEAKYRVHLMEINAGDFCRTVDIPSSVEQEKIGADYSEGMLRITLPKLKEGT